MEIGTEIIKLNRKFRIVFSILNGIMFVGIMCLIDYLIKGNFQSLNSYLFHGIFFGLFMGIGVPYVLQKFGIGIISKIGESITPELSEVEKIEVDGPANLFRGIEGVGGKLFLTNKKVIFKAHKINIQKVQTNIDYLDIKELIKRKTYKFINNGMRIITKEGRKYDFIVNEREKWIEKLNKKMEQRIQSSR